MKRSEFLQGKITLALVKDAKKKLKREVRKTEKRGTFDAENEALKAAATEKPSSYATARANLKVDRRSAAQREGGKSKAEKDEGY
jgi:hypothetical protein